MTEILLIRHGETAWNTERRLQGHIDIGLNAEGLRQARALGGALRNEPLDAIISSDLQRAVHTAQAIADGRDLPVKTMAGLRERCYGAFEGLCHQEIRQRYPQAYQAWQAREMDSPLPEGERPGETVRAFSARILATLTTLAVTYYSRRIAVVAHGGVLECLYRHATGKAWSLPRDFEVRNASVNRVQWNGSDFRIVQWGDTSHLQALALDEVDKL